MKPPLASYRPTLASPTLGTSTTFIKSRMTVTVLLPVRFLSVVCSTTKACLSTLLFVLDRKILIFADTMWDRFSICFFHAACYAIFALLDVAFRRWHGMGRTYGTWLIDFHFTASQQIDTPLYIPLIYRSSLHKLSYLVCVPI